LERLCCTAPAPRSCSFLMPRLGP